MANIGCFNSFYLIEDPVLCPTAKTISLTNKLHLGLFTVKNVCGFLFIIFYHKNIYLNLL